MCSTYTLLQEICETLLSEHGQNPTSWGLGLCLPMDQSPQGHSTPWRKNSGSYRSYMPMFLQAKYGSFMFFPSFSLASSQAALLSSVHADSDSSFAPCVCRSESLHPTGWKQNVTSLIIESKTRCGYTW